MIDVSVIIPSWNAKKYLQDCINSIVRETKHNSIEIIVVDNASSDGSPEMIQKQFQQVKLIRNSENLGFAKACNIGMRQAQGKYFCILNSDVILQKECIDKMFSYMEKNPEIGVLGPKILYPDGRVQRTCMGFPTLWNTFCRATALDVIFPKTRLFSGLFMTFWSYTTLRAVDVINGCLWMVRQNAVNNVGLLDENFFMYAEDKDWCKRFKKEGWQVVFFPDAEAIHFGGASSSNAPIKFYIEMQRANIQYWRKHYSRFAQIGFILITLAHHLIRLVGQVMILIRRPSRWTAITFRIKRSIAGIQLLFRNIILIKKVKSVNRNPIKWN